MVLGNVAVLVGRGQVRETLNLETLNPMTLTMKLNENAFGEGFPLMPCFAMLLCLCEGVKCVELQAF